YTAILQQGAQRPIDVGATEERWIVVAALGRAHQADRVADRLRGYDRAHRWIDDRGVRRARPAERGEPEISRADHRVLDDCEDLLRVGDEALRADVDLHAAEVIVDFDEALALHVVHHPVDRARQAVDRRMDDEAG